MMILDSGLFFGPPCTLHTTHARRKQIGIGTVAALLVAGLSSLRVRWNGTRFHSLSGTLLGVPTTSDRR